jgi:Uncharacterised protein family (UPF0167)
MAAASPRTVRHVTQATFAETGTPFPLFEGPPAHAADTVGEALCSLCDREAFCLELSIGHTVIAPCAACGAPTDHMADGDPQPCTSCAAESALPASAGGEPACLVCLREGRFAITKDSDLGMVRWRDAVAGRTHGLPLPRNADGWQQVRVAREVLLPLVLTPDYESIQGSVWKFHCGQAMTFIGRWGRSEFEGHAPDGDGAAFARALADMDSGPFDGLPESGDDEDAPVWAYAFRCTVCRAFAANWDAE